MNGPSLSVAVRRWRLAKPFRISRGEKTHAVVVEVQLEKDGRVGRGEGVPYGRYGETVEGTVGRIEAFAEAIGAGMSRQELRQQLEAGAARNAIDCALWDLEAKLAGKRAWELAEMPSVQPLVTAFTLSIDSPERLSCYATEHRDRPLLKLKLAGDGSDLDRLRAVHAAAPGAALWLDANEGLSIEACQRLAPHLLDLGVRVLEQPLPAADDQLLKDLECAVPLCADESFRGGVESLAGLSDVYELVNVKLDKSGGLTESLDVIRAARARGLGVVVGCMCSSSLSIAPAILLAQDALFADLDAALLLAEDHTERVRYANGRVYPPSSATWG
ncbi:MAG: N-acetyl-D-Glu racemase DgcA [Polyangiaceae bacterium]